MTSFAAPQRFGRRVETRWQLRSRSLTLGPRTLVMGVVNITPDSFSDGGLYFSTGQATEHALQLLDEGADILDLGAESTRPGSSAGEPHAVSADEEQARLLPVIEAILKARPDTVISADTYKASTARAAIEAGAEIVNDVSGFTWDPGMAAVCASLRSGVVLMHTRGKPQQWRAQPRLVPDDVMPLVQAGLAAALSHALDSGIAHEAIILDPGYGFGKRFDENYALLAYQAELLQLGRPLLAGVSRKSFLAHTIDKRFPPHAGPQARDAASVAATVTAILHGASLVRVHQVRDAVAAAAIADAVLLAG